MSRKTTSHNLAVGEESRVDLLPPELRVRRKAKVVHRRLGFLVFLVALLVAGGIAFGHAQAVQAKLNLSIEQSNTQAILTQQRKFGVVQQIQKQVDLVQAAQQVGTSTEIDWQKYLISVQATLPPNVTIDSVNIDSATPFASYAQASAPLQGARIATLSFTAISSTLPQVPQWLIALSTLKGFADANPGSVTRNESGTYAVNITMHINQAAFSNRFALAVK